MKIDQIYIDYASDVYRFLLSLSHDENIAKELLQETFYRAYVKAKDNQNIYNVRVWLCQIAKYTYFEYCRKQHNEVFYDDSLEIIDSVTPHSILIEKESIKEIFEALEDVSYLQQQIFFLRVYNQMSFQEIGDIFNKSDNWARVHYFRVKHYLREKVEKK